jgi:hypothetical protein
MKKSLLLILFVIMSITSVFGTMDHNVSIASMYSVQDLSQQEIDGILHMREEEKLARDVYLTLYDKWHLPVFNNIASAEQQHMDQIGYLIEKYNLTDPVVSDEVGAFTNEEIGNLYNQLVSQGETSITDALKVGATIEDLDIKDLEDYLAQTDNDDIRAAYQNLMKGSRNHLRSFTSQLNNYGITYEPQYLTQSEEETIINTDYERGIMYGPNGSVVRTMNMTQQGMGMGAQHQQGQGYYYQQRYNNTNTYQQQYQQARAGQVQGQNPRGYAQAGNGVQQYQPQNGGAQQGANMRGGAQGYGNAQNPQGNMQAQGQSAGRGYGQATGNAAVAQQQVQQTVQDNTNSTATGFTATIRNMFRNMFGKLFNWFD